MRRIRLFLVILAVSLGVLLVLFGVSLYLAITAPALYQSGWMRQMWGDLGGMNGGGMMGGGGYGSSAPSYLWIIPAGLIGLVAVGSVGVAFYVAFPEIRSVTEAHETGMKEPDLTGSKKEPDRMQSSSSVPLNPIESVSKTLTAEERKVLNVLVAHQGRHLQKHIRREAGLSRLKTHRIIARFAERGMVTLKQSGNTNEISLSDWLQDPKAQNSA